MAYQIAKLRSVLEPERRGTGTLVTTTPAGYALMVGADEVDALRFERLVGRARAVVSLDPAGAEELLVEALDLWEGRPFADLDGEPFAERWSRRLDQQRMIARRTLAEARIALGRPGEVVAELETLAEDHPLDEELAGLLMTALDASGRTADALGVYAKLRRHLANELGVDPCHRLQLLEHNLLTGGEPSPPSSPRPRPVPAASSSFVGRQAELAELADWLSSTRLVTLCGFGGLGKTRLAQQLAHTITDRFADGVWYVDLAPIADPTDVADTILSAGGRTLPAGRDALDHLLAQLQHAETLIVLDNCEHLVDTVADIATKIVHTAPHVRVLTTSRTPLGVTDEAVWALHPLDLPSAHALLVQRARIAQPGFITDTTNRDTLEQLTRNLDGVPLAIELAAARLATMGLDRLVDHLEQHPDLLTDGRPEPNLRQRSLTTVLDWSYQLLDPTDQQLLRRLTVCTDGFDLDAAHAIGNPDHSTPLHDTIDHLAHLLRAALIQFDATLHPPRYRILEPVHQHTAAHLTADERDDAGRAHAHHYADVAARIFDLWNVNQQTAMHLSADELGNLRSAIDWAYHHDEPRLGLSIACNARGYLFLNQMFRELLRWLQTGLDLVVDDDDDDVIAAAGVACLAAGNLADADAHRAAFDRVTGGFDAVVDPRLRAELLSALSSFELETDPRAAERHTRAAIAMRSSLPLREMALLNNRIDHSWFCGDLVDGEAILRRWEEIHAEMRGVQPGYEKVTAGVAACEGRWDDVVRLTEFADDLEPMFAASVRTLRAEALSALGRHEEALGALAAVDPDSFEQHLRCTDLVHAAIDLRQGRPGAAVEHLAEIVAQISRDDRRLAIGMPVASLIAVAAHDLGQHETAAILFGYAAAERERLDIALRLSNRPLTERAVAECRAALGDDRFDELATVGANTPWRDLPRPATSANGPSPTVETGSVDLSPGISTDR